MQSVVASGGDGLVLLWHCSFPCPFPHSPNMFLEIISQTNLQPSNPSIKSYFWESKPKGDPGKHLPVRARTWKARSSPCIMAEVLPGPTQWTLTDHEEMPDGWRCWRELHSPAHLRHKLRTQFKYDRTRKWPHSTTDFLGSFCKTQSETTLDSKAVVPNLFGTSSQF